MPPLNKFEDFDACLQVYGDDAKFCYVRTAIKPNPSSQLYEFMIKFSSNQKQHFRHDKLTRGVCINTCQELLAVLGSSGDEFFVPEFKLDYQVMTKLLLLRPANDIELVASLSLRSTSTSSVFQTRRRIARSSTG